MRICFGRLPMNKKTRVVIVGTIPSTAGVGGVTIHVSRLLKALKDSDFEPVLCDYKRLPFLSQIKLLRQSKLAHLHVSNPYGRLLYVLLCRVMGIKSMLTIHGNLRRYGLIKNAVNDMAIRWCNVPILINDTSFRQALRLNDAARRMSAYIPLRDMEVLPESMETIIRVQREAGRSIVCTNASGFVYDVNGNDIYGIAFLIDYFNQHKEYFLLISDPSSQYSASYKETLPENIVIISQPHSFVPVLRRADIMIRATSTDGDSISVREALDAGIRVLATDCVDRPDGVILFSYSDKKSLDNALQERNLNNSPYKHSDTIADLCNVYGSLSK